ncbi:MAG: Ldh family oxidoreductase [Candidimonas sp.]|nr:MAG: Ldh family oxidoreductase [Candidimonas sp.]TAM27049.1 MAG: Ldh family oxidoreductase [Candidimonas sp.]
MSESEIVLPIEEIKSVLTRVFNKNRLPDDEAAILIDTLLDAEFRGIKTHGLSRVGLYCQKIINGSIAIPTQITHVSDHYGAGCMDGHDGLGQWIAYKAMQDAMSRAGRYGVGAVSVKNSQHFGTAGYYANMASDRDMIGLAFTNASPRLAPWGGVSKLLGNNPWSIAIPTHNPKIPFVLDISNSMVSAGRIRQALRRGGKIPNSWALDINGEATTDAQAALLGVLLPFGQHKGYGITLAISILSSLLSGGEFDSEVKTIDESASKQHVSHLFVALNVDFFQPIQYFKERMGVLINQLHSSKVRSDVAQIYYPGERGYLQKWRLLEAKETSIDKMVWEGIVALSK